MKSVSSSGKFDYETWNPFCVVKFEKLLIHKDYYNKDQFCRTQRVECEMEREI